MARSSEYLRCFANFAMKVFIYGGRALFFNVAAYHTRFMPLRVMGNATTSPDSI